MARSDPYRFWRPLMILATAATLFAVPAFAQDNVAPLFDPDSLSARSIQLFLLVTVLSIAPALAIMLTCFPFMVTVLAILRQAIGLQQSPPSMLMVSLALFLTYFVMDPVLQAAWQSGVTPYLDGNATLEQSVPVVLEPFRGFMANRMDPGTFTRLMELRQEAPVDDIARDAPLSILIPSFMLSEITRAFEIGFIVFLPFLIIDLVVSAILMSMGMMMVPPAIVALPFKLAFFVVADGWTLLSEALVRSYL
ncbi:MAG: flagellar type III secretion system pore protein FliP [Qingshengfaniella sp.]